MPKFSIIVPVYKVEKYVRQCIESILNQTFQDYEVLVVDDCGGDNSIGIVEEYACHDSRIKILTHDKNRGLAAARNTALDSANGDYILCLDSDDWLEPNCLEIINTEFQIRGTESIWFNARKYFDKTGEFDKQPMYNQNPGYRILTPHNMAAFADFTWIKAYTRKSVQKYNLHWPVGLTFEDGEFYFEYFTLYPKTYVIEDCLINYRYRDGSIVREADRGNIKLNDIFDVVRHLRDFWIKYGVYDRYKITMLKLLQNRVRMGYGLNYSDENKRLSLKFLNDINYPKDFEEFDSEKKKLNPLVTVVVPVYNVEDYVEECIASIQNQTYNNLEIICVDDCGQDNSVNIVTKIAKKDSRIKLVHHKKNKGLGGARNTGLEKGKGKYIFFVDSDDWIEKDCIETVVNKLEETGFDSVFFKADVFWQDRKTRTPIWYKSYANHEEGPFTIDSHNMCYLPHYSWNKGYRREFLIKNNIKWQENVIYEDMEFFFRLFMKSHCTYMIDKSLYIYRRRSDSIIGQCYGNLKNAEDLYKVTKRIKDYLVDNDEMEQYQNEFLHLVCNNLNNYRGFGDIHDKQIPMMIKFLNDIKFPEDYKESI